MKGELQASHRVETLDTPEGPRLLSATDLQIVNGGQTTASLALARRKDGAELSGIFVQMKLSVVDAEKSADLIPTISEFAKRQTKVFLPRTMAIGTTRDTSKEKIMLFIVARRKAWRQVLKKF
jgi:hypothetical protein